MLNYKKKLNNKKKYFFLLFTCNINIFTIFALIINPIKPTTMKTQLKKVEINSEISEIKEFCNLHLYTDIEPYEVVQVINPKKVVIRALHATRISEMEFVPGGFAGHCTNNYAQKWAYESLPNANTITITLTKKGWGQGRFKMNHNPIKFYDFNF